MNMKRTWSALILYAVSLAVFIFQFIIPGYSEVLYYVHMAVHATLWFIAYYLARHAAGSRAPSVVSSVVAASLFSLAPVDIIVPSLFDQSAGQDWLTFVLRFVIHLTCLVVMVLVVQRAESSS